MIQLDHVSKTFTGGSEVHAVRDVSLDIAQGEIFGIIGFSGAGKSTLVRCINLLERPTAGEVIVDGQVLVDIPEDGKGAVRMPPAQLRETRKKIGMIFQLFNLMPSRTVDQNVAFPLKGTGLSKQAVADKVKKLLELVEPTEHPEWGNTVESFRNTEAESRDVRPGLTPRNAMLILDKRLTEATPVATDVGQHQMWAAQTLSFRQPRRFVSSGGLGTMGFGMGAAMGAQMATGEHAVLVTGDGSFGMNLNELATAVTYRVPLVILLLNNGVLGMVRQWQTLFFDKHYSNTTLERKTDFVKLAEAFGAKGERTDTPEGLDEALERAFQYEGPYLIDCLISEDEFVLPMLPPGGSMDDMITKVGD